MNTHDETSFGAAETGGRGSGRAEIACDGYTSGPDILKAVDAAPGLVALRLTPGADASARAAVLAAWRTLSTGPGRVRILIDLPAESDGTDLFRRGPTPMHAVVALTEDLRDAGADLCWAIPLQTPLVWKLDSLFSLAAERGVSAILVPGTAPLAPDAQLFVWDFVTYFLLGEARAGLGSAATAYYEALQRDLYHDRLGDGPAGAGGALLSAALAGTGAASDAAPAVSLGEVRELAGEGLRAHMSATRAALRPRTTLPDRLQSALLVGAYGGEHIGDMAILGGVLFRLHREFGLTEAVLLTQRPNHTRHLVEMLETPVRVTVDEYGFAEIDRHLRDTDALVHAGGPLTDIPKQLVRHLYAAGLARRTGKPYLMEGIGPTTFKRAASRVTARRLVGLADRIRLRTRDDASRPIIQGLPVEVGHDPAFDYLETRGAALTRLLPHEPAEIEALLADTNDRPLIGVNIRPINDLFTPQEPGRDRATTTAEVEDRMERNLADGLARFAAESDRKPVFVFFPMNAIQFGKSDNRSAFRITRHLPGHVDARVWHSDASLDAVVALIRRLDTVISMRFHATIFALSQKCPPIGIDYRIGQKYKVTAVMEDAGEADFCCRIDTVDPAWIAARLGERVAARAGA